MTSKPRVNTSSLTAASLTQAQRTTMTAKRKAHLEMFDLLGRHLSGDPTRLLWATRQNIGREVLPGITSDNPQYLSFMERAIDALNKELPPDLDASSNAGENGIPSTFDSARTMTGYSMPQPYVLADNSMDRVGLKLPSTFKTPRHQAIFEALHHQMFGYSAEDATARYNPLASLGFPSGRSGRAARAGAVTYLVENHDELLRAFASHDLAAWVKHGAFPLTRTTLRDQNDSWVDGAVKKRAIPTYEYAMSGGRDGSTWVPDRDIKLKGTGPTGFVTKRSRLAYMPTGLVNMVGTLLSAGQRLAYLTRLAFTFHHTTPAAIARKLERFDEVFQFDVTRYDSTFPRAMVEHKLKLDALTNGELYAEMKRNMWFSHVYQPPTVPDDPTSWLATWTNEHSAFDHSTFPGLPSGAWFNPDEGKFFMTWDLLCTFDDIFGDAVEEIETILTGQHPWYAILDAADDIKIGIKAGHPVLDRAVAAWRTEGTRPTTYFAAEYGKGAFLGSVAYRADGAIRACPNIVTYFANFFAPERPITHPSRSNWALGYLERQRHYAAAPSFGIAKQLIDEAWRAKMSTSITLDGLARREYEATLASRDLFERLSRSQHLTAIDHEILQEPSKLFWKFTDYDVHPELLKELSVSVSAAETFAAARKYFRGTIINSVEHLHEAQHLDLSA